MDHAWRCTAREGANFEILRLEGIRDLEGLQLQSVAELCQGDGRPGASVRQVEVGYLLDQNFNSWEKGEGNKC